MVAFAHSPNTQIVPQSRRGSQWNGLAHVSDLFATWSQLAGVVVVVVLCGDQPLLLEAVVCGCVLLLCELCLAFVWMCVVAV